MNLPRTLPLWSGIGMGVLRAAAAAGLLWICAGDLPRLQAWAELESLPDYNYHTEALQLTEQKRYSEALLLINTGLGAGVSPLQQFQLAELLTRVERERKALLTRVQQAAEGALTGTGDSPEALAGAVAADLFVFGDVRDLVIQGGHYLRGEETDQVIVALSAAGIALTTMPGLDFGTALLKFARRVGAMGDALAGSLLRVARRALDSRATDEIGAVAGQAAMLGREAGPAGAVAILRNVNDVDELRLVAHFSEKPRGALALWLGGRPVIVSLKALGSGGEWLLLRGVRKGRAGLDYVARHSGVLLRVHPVTGLLKGIYKGNVPALIGQWLQDWSALLLGFAGGWLLFELGLIVSRAAQLRR